MASEQGDRRLPLGTMLVDRFRVGALLGRGGTASVYEAVDARGGNVVAVKVLNPPSDERPFTRDSHRLLEAQLAMRLQSPHSIKLFEVGALSDGRPFLVMERLFGNDVARTLLERGPMPVMDACDIALQACHALAEAHRLGVVHRDIKPANLFLTTRRDGSPHVKVVDFGLAPLVSSQVAGPSLGPGKTWRVAGSPGYAAPEQIGSQRSVDERADVWGLGIVLYELVLGRRPFGGETLIDALIAAGSDPVPPMGAVPKDFEAIVRRCLEKDRERRFPNMAALAEALAPLAPPALADYPDLVRIAAGGAFTSAESTQRLLVDDEGARSSVPSRANSALDGAHGAPPSSRGRADATGTDALRVADGTSSFIAQVVPVEAPPWAGFVAVVLACTVALSIVISHAESHRPQVAPASQAPPSSSSMLLPPLPKSGGSATPHESNSDWEAAGRDWQEAH